MIFTLERVTQPEVEPVTLAEMKRHLRAFAQATSLDNDISALIVAAREWAEDYTGRALIDQMWRLTLSSRHGHPVGDMVGGFKGPGQYPHLYRGIWRWGRHGEIMLRKAPVLELTSFVSVDAAGTETRIDPATYELREANSKWPRLVALNGATWSTWLAREFRIEYRAGFADRTGSPEHGGEMVPERFLLAIKLYAESMYDRDPKTITLLLDVAERLLKQERSDLQIA